MLDGLALDRAYAALAHPVRREVLDRLGAGPARVTDIAARFDISLAAVSKHIRFLEEAGLVSRQINGRDHLLAVVPGSLDEASRWIAARRAFWTSRLDDLDRHLRRDG